MSNSATEHASGVVGNHIFLKELLQNPISVIIQSLMTCFASNT